MTPGRWHSKFILFGEATLPMKCATLCTFIRKMYRKYFMKMTLFSQMIILAKTLWKNPKLVTPKLVQNGPNGLNGRIVQPVAMGAQNLGLENVQ